MIIKLEKIVSCASEHPSYPASNLLKQQENASWRCAKPGIMMASVIFKFAEPSTIIGLDIGNYRSCAVVVEASTSEEPDNWVSIAQHQFMTHDEAYNEKWRDQVQLFTRSELNAVNVNTKFSRVKVTCMQSANRSTLFGLSFIVFKTDVTGQLSDAVLERFKLKPKIPGLETFKEKFFKQLDPQKPDYMQNLAKKVKEIAAERYKNSDEGETSLEVLNEDKPEKADEKVVRNVKKVDNNYKIVQKIENQDEAGQESYFSSLGSEKLEEKRSDVERTPFGDVLNKKRDEKKDETITNSKTSQKGVDESSPSRNNGTRARQPGKCVSCARQQSDDSVCPNCGKLPPQKTRNSSPRAKRPRVPPKPKKDFEKLFEDVKFTLSGYVNPQRDEIRRKALKMGAKYVADVNANNPCTHLVCAFPNTPKYQQLKGRAKIVSHRFIEKCFEEKKRLPWRRFALVDKDKLASESEEEIEAKASSPNPYEEETDSEY